MCPSDPEDQHSLSMNPVCLTLISPSDWYILS